MNKKIKVIELLNMIANKEKLPKKIRYAELAFKNRVYELNEGISIEYVCREEVIEADYLFSDHNTNILNDYVEILEDEEDNDISSLNAFKLMEAPYMAKCLDKNSHEEFMEHLKQSEVEIVHKIRELIEKVNKLDKKINKEE